MKNVFLLVSPGLLEEVFNADFQGFGLLGTIDVYANANDCFEKLERLAFTPQIIDSSAAYLKSYPVFHHLSLSSKSDYYIFISANYNAVYNKKKCQKLNKRVRLEVALDYFLDRIQILDQLFQPKQKPGELVSSFHFSYGKILLEDRRAMITNKIA